MRRIDYVEDCQDIQAALLRIGYEASLAECQELWEHRSKKVDAMWVILPDSYYIVDDIEDWCEDCKIWQNRNSI
jgi:hypothetical protein